MAIETDARRFIMSSIVLESSLPDQFSPYRKNIEHHSRLIHQQYEQNKFCQEMLLDMAVMTSILKFCILPTSIKKEKQKPFEN
jgi:hypothetical protein